MLKKMKKATACFVTGLMLLGSLSACGSAAQETPAVSQPSAEAPAASDAPAPTPAAPAEVTLDVINYHVGTDFAAEYYSYLFDAFAQTEEGKNVKFNFEEIPTTDAFNQKIKLLISSGDLPDIVFNGGNNITEMAAQAGKVADLTPYFDADPEWKALFDERSLAFNTVDDKIYGVPVSKEISYIYYNKELFAQAGIEEPGTSFATWDDFFAACDKLKAAGITPVGMDSADSGWLSNLWYCALIATRNSSGEDWMNLQYPADYNTPELIEATTILQRMLAQYTTPDAIGGRYDPMATHFFNGEVAMFPNGPWMIPDFRNPEKAPEGFYDKVGIMLLPGDAMELVPTPGDMVGAKDPAKIDAAVAFLKFSTSIENQIKALEMTGLQPVSPKVTVPDTLEQSDPLMAAVLELAGQARITYGQNQAYWFQNTIDVFSTNLPELAYGNMSPEEFCQALTEAAAKN